MLPLRFTIVLLAIAANVGLVYYNLQSQIASSGQHHDPLPITCDMERNEDAVQRFAQLLTYPALSRKDSVDHIDDDTRAVFTDMISYLASTYSLAWETMQVEMLGAGNYTTLLKWQGSSPSLLPILFVSHYDVVPVTQGTEKEWRYKPFSGAVEEGFIWGRGALDVKFSVSALLEAATQMIQDGFVPSRTIYITFGHDEEVGGKKGAAEVAQVLAARGIQFDMIMDEGGIILEDGVKPFTKLPVALVGTSEKVYTTIEVKLTSAGGHSSMPPTDGKDVATQIAKLISYTRSQPFPALLRQPMPGFLKSLVPYTNSSLLKFIMCYCDAWPLRMVIPHAFVHASPSTAALVRTTLAVTTLSAGVADNVLPQQGTVIFNLRAHPEGETRDTILQYFNDAITRTGASGSARIHEATYLGAIPSVTDHEGRQFRAVKQAIQETWQHDGKAIAVSPYLMTGGTDSKHFTPLAKNGVLRFTPYKLNRTAGDMDRIHGTNERVLVADFKRAICTYRRMMDLLSSNDP